VISGDLGYISRLGRVEVPAERVVHLEDPRLLVELSGEELACRGAGAGGGRRWRGGPRRRAEEAVAGQRGASDERP